MTMSRDDRIKEHAHTIWEMEGRPDGRHEAHWEKARAAIDEEDARRSRGQSDKVIDPSLPAPQGRPQHN